MLEANALLVFLFIQTVPSALIKMLDVLNAQRTLESRLQGNVQSVKIFTHRAFYVLPSILDVLNAQQVLEWIPSMDALPAVRSSQIVKHALLTVEDALPALQVMERIVLIYVSYVRHISQTVLFAAPMILVVQNV
jgi:hypothetical protein